MTLLFLTIIGTISVGSFSLSNIGILVAATILLVILVTKKDSPFKKTPSATVPNFATAQEYISDSSPSDFPDDIQEKHSQKTNSSSSETESYGQQEI